MAGQYASNQPSGYNNHIRNIAIVGATGHSGKFIVEALLAKSLFNITAITRSGSAPPAPGVHIATVDYSEPSTLVQALKGQDVLIITLAVTAPPDTSSKLVEAAAEAGVPWILPNEFGNDTDDEVVSDDNFIGPSKRKQRKLIEDLGVSSWIGVATGFWYEHSLGGPGLYGIDVVTKEVVFFDDAQQRLNTSTWPLVGKSVANLLALPIVPKDELDKSVTLDGYRNRFVFVSSFTLNQREMLETVQRVTGTTDRDWKISSVSSKERFEAAKKRMLEGDHMAFGEVLYTRYFYPGENAGLPEVTKGLDNEKLGLEKEDLDEATKRAVELSQSDYYQTFR